MQQNKKKRIAFVVVGRLGKSLIVQKVKPMVLTNVFEKIYIFSQEPGYYIDDSAVYVVSEQPLSIFPGFIRRYARIILEPFQLLLYAIRYKPMLINGIGLNPKGYNTILVSKICSIKSIISIIGGPVEIHTNKKYKRIWKALNIWILREASAITTTGTVVTDYITSLIPGSNKIFDYPGAIDTDIFYYNQNETKDIDILFLGTFRKLKGPDRVISVVEKLMADGHSINAYFLGQGYMLDDMKKLVREKKMCHCVTFLGHVENPINYLQRAKMLLMPSRSEGLPKAMLEAMSCECVPIISNVGNIRDAVEHNKNGYIVDDFMDLETFCHYSSELLMDMVKMKRMSSLARVTVMEKFSIEVHKQTFRQVLQYLYGDR